MHNAAAAKNIPVLSVVAKIALNFVVKLAKGFTIAYVSRLV